MIKQPRLKVTVGEPVEPVSKDPIISIAIDSLKGFNWNHSSEPTLINYKSSTGMVLPSDFSPPSGNYDISYGDITCTYTFDFIEKGYEICPYICAIGDSNSADVGHGYLHNIVAKPFMGDAEIASVAAFYPGIDIANMYPDKFPVAIVALVFPDGSIYNVPVEANFVSDGREIQITYTQDICEALSGASGLTETVVGSRI